MNPVRAINMAAGKALNMDGMPSGTKAVDTLTNIAELHKLPDAALQFALAKYNKDLGATFKAAHNLKKIARVVAGKRGWRYESESTLNNAAILALLQHSEPAKLGHTCWGCNGTGGAVNSQCQKCQGSGYRARPDVLYASILDISDTAYRKTWESRVAVLYTIAGMWDNDLFKEWAKRHVLEPKPL